VRGKHPILLIAPAIPSLATANRLAGMILYFIGLLVLLVVFQQFKICDL
jgi:hypothetical protein